MTNSAEEDWLTRLEQFRPATGQLTTEILAKAGPLPGLGDVFNESMARAYVATRLEAKTNRLSVESHNARRAGDSAEADRLTAELNYWTSVLSSI